MDPVRQALARLCDAFDALPGPLGPHVRTAVQEVRLLLSTPPIPPARPAAPIPPPEPPPLRRSKGV